jgi:sugar fermentation stimulation protein A
MRFDPPLQPAVLLRRYKRFLADVIREGVHETVHCPNTGAMRGCSQPGARVWLSLAGNPARRCPRTLEQVEAVPGVVVGVHPGRANDLVAEALDAGLLPALQGYRARRREWRYGEEGSRADFLLEDHRDAPPCVLEVKSVTALAAPGVAEFPDAVSVRATRHLRELAAWARTGGRAALVFCVQRDDARVVRPARDVDPAYAGALERAIHAGVAVHALAARVGPRELVLYREVAVSLA